MRNKDDFWKEASPPYFDKPDDTGNYKLLFQPGDENWFGDSFRVGDRVLHDTTGQYGEVVETLDVGRYSVHLDSGDVIEVDGVDLREGSSYGDPGDPHSLEVPSHEDYFGHERFMGDDPEAQNFEDPTFSGDPEQLDDATPVLTIGDIVHIFNPYDENGTFLDAEGTVSAVNSGSYTVETNVGQGEFVRAELELLSHGDPKGTLAKKRAAPKSPFKLPWEEIDESRPEVDAVPYYSDLPRYGPNDQKPKNKSDYIGKPKLPAPPSVGKDELARRGLTVEAMAQNVYAAYRWANEEQKTRGMTWYDDANASATRSVHDHPDLVESGAINVDMMVGVFAVISPNLNWEKNTLYPSLIVRQYFKEGVTDPTKWREDEVFTYGKDKGQRKKMAIMNTNRNKVLMLFAGEPPDNLITAPKTNSFFHNIAGDTDRVTVDIWAMRICMGDLKPLSNTIDPWTGERLAYGGPSNNAYEPMAEAYRMATEMIRQEGEEMTPRELQAITWGVYRDLGTNAGIDLSEPPAEGLVPEEELARMLEQQTGVDQPVLDQQPSLPVLSAKASFWLDFYDG